MRCTLGFNSEMLKWKKDEITEIDLSEEPKL